MTANDPGRALDEAWAFTSTRSGEEGVIGVVLPGLGLTPLVAFDETRREQFRLMAREVEPEHRERHYVDGDEVLVRLAVLRMLLELGSAEEVHAEVLRWQDEVRRG